MEKFLSPSELHERANNIKPVEEKEVTNLSVYKAVSAALNSSSGVHRIPCNLKGIQTKEYAIVPVSSEAIDEAYLVKESLENQNYYVKLKSDALARFREEVIMVICWDPEVLNAPDDEDDDFVLDKSSLYCVMPGNYDKLCDHCMRCHCSDVEFIVPDVVTEE